MHFDKKRKMKAQTIDKETSNKVNFMTFIITKFARAYKMYIQVTNATFLFRRNKEKYSNGVINPNFFLGLLFS